MISYARTAAVAGLAGLAAACAGMSMPGSGTDLLADGLGGWVKTGDANWSYADGVAQATEGPGVSFLLTPDDYDDFELTLEFQVDAGDSNSGVYFRCADRDDLRDTTCYEANIFDDRDDQSGRTGAIVHVAPPLMKIDSAGRWNSYRIRAKGDHLTVWLNGEVTVDVHDATHSSAGPIGLQWGSGVVMFRNVRVKRI